eukprot:COSAG01_NODE_2670_length_7274_cov_4.395540_1_plen_405_part_00
MEGGRDGGSQRTSLTHRQRRVETRRVGPALAIRLALDEVRHPLRGPAPARPSRRRLWCTMSAPATITCGHAGGAQTSQQDDGVAQLRARHSRSSPSRLACARARACICAHPGDGSILRQLELGEWGAGDVPTHAHAPGWAVGFEQKLLGVAAAGGALSLVFPHHLKARTRPPSLPITPTALSGLLARQAYDLGRTRGAHGRVTRACLGRSPPAMPLLLWIPFFYSAGGGLALGLRGVRPSAPPRVVATFGQTGSLGRVKGPERRRPAPGSAGRHGAGEVAVPCAKGDVNLARCVCMRILPPTTTTISQLSCAAAATTYTPPLLHAQAVVVAKRVLRRCLLMVRCVRYVCACVCSVHSLHRQEEGAFAAGPAGEARAAGEAQGLCEARAELACEGGPAQGTGGQG